MKCLVSFKNKNSYSCVFQPTSNIGVDGVEWGVGGGGLKVRHNRKDNLFFFSLSTFNLHPTPLSKI